MRREEKRIFINSLEKVERSNILMEIKMIRDEFNLSVHCKLSLYFQVHILFVL